MEKYQEATTNKDKIKTKNKNKCPKEDWWEEKGKGIYRVMSSRGDIYMEENENNHIRPQASKKNFKTKLLMK
jgi:transposase